MRLSTHSRDLKHQPRFTACGSGAAGCPRPCVSASEQISSLTSRRVAGEPFPLHPPLCVPRRPCTEAAGCWVLARARREWTQPHLCSWVPKAQVLQERRFSETSSPGRQGRTCAHSPHLSLHVVDSAAASVPPQPHGTTRVSVQGRPQGLGPGLGRADGREARQEFPGNRWARCRARTACGNKQAAAAWAALPPWDGPFQQAGLQPTPALAGQAAGSAGRSAGPLDSCGQWLWPGWWWSRCIGSTDGAAGRGFRENVCPRWWRESRGRESWALGRWLWPESFYSKWPCILGIHANSHGEPEPVPSTQARLSAGAPEASMG